MKYLILLILLVVSFNLSAQNRTIPSPNSRSFMWNGDKGEFVEVEFFFYLEGDSSIVAPTYGKMKRLIMESMGFAKHHVATKYTRHVSRTFTPLTMTVLAHPDGKGILVQVEYTFSKGGRIINGVPERNPVLGQTNIRFAYDYRYEKLLTP
jgi:hypothetical protein